MAKIHHVISVREFSELWINGELFPLIRKMREVKRAGGSSDLAGKCMVTLFYGSQAISLTRLSFEAAMLRLGGSLLHTVHNTTAIPQGMALEAVVRLANINGADIVVLEHPARTTVQRLAKHCVTLTAPIIYAGDGVDHGPTEAFSLAFTRQDAQLEQPSNLFVLQSENNLYVRMALLYLMLM